MNEIKEKKSKEIFSCYYLRGFNSKYVTVSVFLKHKHTLIVSISVSAIITLFLLALLKVRGAR